VHGSFGTIHETFRPVGLDICKGIYSSAFVKDPADPQWEADHDMKVYFDFMKQHVPDIEAQNRTALSSFVSAQVMAHVIERAGQNPTRESLLACVLQLDNPRITSLLMPGVQMKPSNEDRYLFSNEVMAQFDGRIWNQLAA
jgi:branched-chain amino acid transport system substrate-binding protein